MPPYRAQLGGLEGSGVYPTASAAPDWAGIINAAAGGASSLIHGAFVRKLARNQQALAVQKEAREQQRVDQENDFRMREMGQKDEELRLKKLTSGVTPSTTTTTPAMPGADVTVKADLPAAMPGVATLEPGASPAAPVPVPPDQRQSIARLRVPAQPSTSLTTPESYDPTKAAGYVKTIDVAKLKTDAATQAQAAARAGSMARVERSAELAAQRQLEHDQRVQKGKAAIVARGLTANALETWRKQMADGVIQNHDGDLNAAEDFLANDDLGRKYAVRGLSGEDLYAAAGRFRAAAGRAATGILSSTSPERAVEKVGQVRKLMRPGGPAAAAGGTPAPIATPGGGGAPKASANVITAAEATALKARGWTDKAISDSGYVVAKPRTP